MAYRTKPPKIRKQKRPNGRVSAYISVVGHRHYLGEYGTAEASRMSGVQSTEFRYLSDNSPLLDNIRLEILPRGDSSPRVQYPPQREVRTAGDWNRIAGQNNSIEVHLIHY